MKYLLLILFVGVVHASSIFPMTEIFLDIKINYEKLKSSCDSIKKFETESFSHYADLFCDETGFLYPSPFDTTVSIGMYFDEKMIWLERLGQYCDGDIGKGFITRGKPASHQFSEVLVQEFGRLQQLGIFDISKDSVEALSADIISKIKKEFESCPDIDMVEFDNLNLGPYPTSKYLYGCCSLVNSPSALPATSWAPSNIRVAKTGENGFLIQSAKIGSAYALFDLNGKVLEQGALLSRTIQPPMLPAVLKIQERTMLLK